MHFVCENFSVHTSGERLVEKSVFDTNEKCINWNCMSFTPSVKESCQKMNFLLQLFLLIMSLNDK